MTLAAARVHTHTHTYTHAHTLTQTHLTSLGEAVKGTSDLYALDMS